MKTLSVVTHIFVVILSVYCNPCTRKESVDITNGVTYENGSIFHDGVLYNSDLWYETEEEEQVLKFGCPCVGRVCVWKCCGPGKALFNKTCNDTDMEVVNPYSPTVYKGSQPTSVVAHQHFFYMYNPLCEDRYLVDENSPSEELYIQENGTLFEIAIGGQQWHLPTTYCADFMMDNVSTAPRMVATVCYPEDTTEDSSALYIAYAVGMLLSVPFLLATFLVYAFIPELRNVHGMCLMAYCMGLIVAYPFLAYLKLHSGDVPGNMSVCLSIAFIIYYAFQTSFFWLNVMCFDIWRTFRGYRGGSTNKRRERRRFAMYAAYAWGAPAVLTAITMGMQFSNNLPQSVIQPGLGVLKCWFVDRLSELVYFYIPVLVLVVCNVVLFSITAHRIRSIKQETAILKGAESGRSDKLSKDKQRYALYLKLFVVMGVNWCVELVSYVVGGSNWYWILIDLSNIILGFFIFIIFVWKNKVRNLVIKKWRGVRATRSAESSTGRWTTRSSTAPTEDTRVSSEESAIRLKEIR